MKGKWNATFRHGACASAGMIDPYIDHVTECRHTLSSSGGLMLGFDRPAGVEVEVRETS